MRVAPSVNLYYCAAIIYPCRICKRLLSWIKQNKRAGAQKALFLNYNSSGKCWKSAILSTFPYLSLLQVWCISISFQGHTAHIRAASCFRWGPECSKTKFPSPYVYCLRSSWSVSGTFYELLGLDRSTPYKMPRELAESHKRLISAGSQMLRCTQWYAHARVSAHSTHNPNPHYHFIGCTPSLFFFRPHTFPALLKFY